MPQIRTTPDPPHHPPHHPPQFLLRFCRSTSPFFLSHRRTPKVPNPPVKHAGASHIRWLISYMRYYTIPEHAPRTYHRACCVEELQAPRIVAKHIGGQVHPVRARVPISTRESTPSFNRGMWRELLAKVPAQVSTEVCGENCWLKCQQIYTVVLIPLRPQYDEVGTTDGRSITVRNSTRKICAESK